MIPIKKLKELSQLAKEDLERLKKKAAEEEKIKLENEKLEKAKKLEESIKSSLIYIEKEIILAANKGENVYKYGFGENPVEDYMNGIISELEKHGFEISLFKEKNSYYRNYETGDMEEYYETMMRVRW